MKRLLLFLSLFLLAVAPYGRAERDDDGPFDEIIIFGASMSDTGNAFILSGGQYGGPPNFGHRFSNGPVWVEFLAEHLGLGTPTEQNPVPGNSEATGDDKGTNYAVAGAGTGSGLSLAGAPNMGLQIDFFLVRDGGTLDGDELIVVQGGGNEHSPVIAARNVLANIARLADAGGKHFLVNNMPRASQAPGIFNDGWADHFVATYDKLMEAGLDLIEAKHDITVYRFDMLGLSDDIIANPADYGLTNITDPLRANPGGEPDEYVWWDPNHFTTTVHKFLAEAAADLILD